MLNLVRDLRPDVAVICGDVFDQRRPGHQAVELFHETISALLDLHVTVLVLGGATDDLEALHLGARWVRQQGLYLLSQPSQVLSPIALKAKGDEFTVHVWCLPFAKSDGLGVEREHPAQHGRRLVEMTVNRLDPSAVNLFAGYVWVQGAGRREELGQLVSPGGQPLEGRLLEYFDYSALGGVHQPSVLGNPTRRYCGGLLATELQADVQERSVAMVTIDGKGKVVVDEYPLRSRRAFKLLSGSMEELLEQRREERRDDLLVLRLQDKDLTVDQQAYLRSLGSNIVSVEIESRPKGERNGNPQSPSSLLCLMEEFYDEVCGLGPLPDRAVEKLTEFQAKL